MHFQSIGFLFLFLPVLLLGLRLTPAGWPRRLTLVAFSYLFYSASEPLFVLVLLASSITDYIVALRLSVCSQQIRRRLWLCTSILINLSLLAFFKYGGFILTELPVLGVLLALPFAPEDFYLTFLLPAGISFYTFQSLSYSIDVYRGEVQPTRNLVGFFNYVSYLPQLVAGPIERYRKLGPQLDLFCSGRSKPDYRNGLNRLSLGLVQKLLVADACGRVVDGLVGPGQSFDLVTGWLFALAFGLQIYYDFAAYVNMALGIALMMGIHLSENFLSPYKAVNIQDFWRRWHITLSQWLRDYLYFPLGGSRLGHVRTLVNILITFLLCGLWHGAGYNYLLWGVLHGLMLCLYRVYRLLPVSVTLPVPIGWFLTFCLVMFAWVPFRITDLDVVITIWQGMVGLNGVNLSDAPMFDSLMVGVVMYLTLRLPNCAERMPGSSSQAESALLWLLAIAALYVSPQVDQFIYFQF